MDDYLTPPEGWYFAAFPWHAMDDIPELPKLVPVGPVLLPEFFHLVIATKETWDGRGSTPTDYSNMESRMNLFLNFQVWEDQVEMVEATTAWRDISTVFEQVRKVVPSKRWKSIGINYMTRYLTRFMEAGGRPDADPARGVGWHWPNETPGASPYEFRPKEAVAWLDKLQERAAEAYATARDRPSPRKKRTRITDEFLNEVTNVYRMAENSELPPTREVANYYKAPHSTAAKWVAAARKKGLLPPASDASNEAARAAAKPTAPDKRRKPTKPIAEVPNESRRRELQGQLQDLSNLAADYQEGDAELAEVMELSDTLREELAALGGELPEQVD
ncbi:hypothetical protein [Streptomyces sp. NPDC058252]|uniref:hypothetical protein n=1 Tax=Streptomyces sp. NPDC058252 TaxID=3346405 RepID=UPI0036E77DD4